MKHYICTRTMLLPLLLLSLFTRCVTNIDSKKSNKEVTRVNIDVNGEKFQLKDGFDSRDEFAGGTFHQSDSGVWTLTLGGYSRNGKRSLYFEMLAYNRSGKGAVGTYYLEQFNELQINTDGRIKFYHIYPKNTEIVVNKADSKKFEGYFTLSLQREIRDNMGNIRMETIPATGDFILFND